MNEIPNCFYRVSVKALILDETRTKFLIMKEESGAWGVPGGGLDHNRTPQEDLPREIDEEMGLKVTWIAEHPSYFSAGRSPKRGTWIVNVVYEATVENLDFTPSYECTEIMFVSPEEALELDTFPDVTNLAQAFKPKNHIK